MSLSPYLCANNAAEAIKFYTQAFGAEESSSRILDNTGRIGHASFQIAGDTFYIADEHPEIGVTSATSLGGSPVSFCLQVNGPAAVDTIFKRAVAAGAEVVSEPEDQFYGERSAQVKDPYGLSWSLQAAVETLTDEEIAARVEGQYTVEPTGN